MLLIVQCLYTKMHIKHYWNMSYSRLSCLSFNTIMFHTTSGAISVFFVSLDVPRNLASASFKNHTYTWRCFDDFNKVLRYWSATPVISCVDKVTVRLRLLFGLGINTLLLGPVPVIYMVQVGWISIGACNSIYMWTNVPCILFSVWEHNGENGRASKYLSSSHIYRSQESPLPLPLT